MNAAPCDLCHESDFSVVAQLDRHRKPMKTVICRTCGLVQHQQIPSEVELQQFYSTIYREQYNGERVPGNRRIMRAWNNGERICQQIAPLLPPGGRILEVGAGIGCTVKVFELAGFRAQGIDPGGEFLSFSHDKLHANVANCGLHDFPAGRTFDAVLLVHVIEHLRAPTTALQKIASLLKPGGMLYVECPNLAAPFARHSQLFHSAHIYNFVPATLQMLGEATGFRLRRRFGDERDPNLQMLLEYTGECRLHVDRENYARTLQELRRARALRYFLRLRYLIDRFRKLAGYGTEFLQAQAFVRKLISDSECRQLAAAKSKAA